jgi:hypothetical protein
MKQKIYTGGNYLKIDSTNENDIRVHGSQYPSSSTTFNETWVQPIFDDSQFVQDRAKANADIQNSINEANTEYNREMQDLNRIYDETRDPEKRADIKKKMLSVRERHAQQLLEFEKQLNDILAKINEEESRARQENVPILNGFRIINIDSGGIIDITKTQIDNGEIVNEKGEPFDTPSLQDFLQNNSGGQIRL